MRIIKKKVTVIALLCLMGMSVLTGCGAPKNLEDYMNDNNESMAKLEQSLAGSGMTIEAKDNTLIYTYNYPDTYTSEEIALMKSAMDSQVDQLSSTFTTIADQLENDTEIDDISVRITYINGDGSEIYSKDFS